MQNKYLFSILLLFIIISCHKKELQDNNHITYKDVYIFDSLVYSNQDKVFKHLKEIDTTTNKGKQLYYYCLNQFDLIYFQRKPNEIGTSILKSLQLNNKQQDVFFFNKNLILLGKYHTLTNNYPEALEAFLSALDYFEKTHDYYNLAHICNGLGILYFDIKNYDLSEKYFNKGLENFEKSKDYRGEAVIRSNLANVLMLKGKTNSAFNELNKSLNKFKINKDSFNVVNIYINIADYYIEINNYKLAKENLEQALLLVNIETETRLKERILFTFGKIFYLQNDLKNAEFYLNESYTLANKNGFLNEKLKALDLISEIYEKQHNLNKLNNSLKHYIALKDTIFGLENRNRIEDIRSDYNFNKQKLKEELINKEYIYQKNKTNLLIFIVTLIILFIGLFLFFLIKNKNKNILIKKIENLRLTEESKRIATELTIEKTQNELLSFKAKQQEIDLEVKNRELTTLNLQLIDKNNLMNEISDAVKNASEKTEFKVLDKQIKEILYKNSNNENDWKLFKEVFEKIHPDFFTKIKEKYPSISKTEMRVCAYIKINMSNTEIANILNISVQSLIKSRYRIRKKMELNSSYNLDEHIIRFF